MNSHVDIVAAQFDRLAIQGVYHKHHTHGEGFKMFVQNVLHFCLPRVLNQHLKLLEIGCGAGAWLEFIFLYAKHNNIPLQIYGTDLSSSMVDICRQRFSKNIDAANFSVGNALDESGFLGRAADFDIMFIYDVIQQLPKNNQIEFIDNILKIGKKGSKIIIIDNDSRTTYGRRMWLKKKITRIGIPLVPKYYCYASYPSFADFEELCIKKRKNFFIFRYGGCHKKAIVIEV